MNYTVTTNEHGFTNLNVADYLIQVMDFLRLAQKNWPIFEKIYGKPFDIMAFTPDDYVFGKDERYSYDNTRWKLDIGEGWKLTLNITNSTLYQKRSTVFPHDSQLFVEWEYDNNWCTRMTFSFFNGKLNAIQTPLKTADGFMNDIFTAIKRRAAVTIREHRNYMTRPQFYDTLETELNIKIRKKK